MSYLWKRTQMVQVEVRMSKPIEGGEYSVPQGSVLRGLLHIINTNDYPACHTVGKSVIFVDGGSGYTGEDTEGN